MIAEDPVGVRVAIANGVVETTKGVMAGNAGAITEATSFIASSLYGAKAASAGAQVAGVVSRVARSADEVAEAAVDAAKAVGRANRARQAAQQAERAVPDELAPVTRVSTGGAERTLHPLVQEVLDGTPKKHQERWHGHCAEPGCVSRALEAGVDPAGGKSRAVKIGKSGKGHGTPKPTCKSCRYLLDHFGVEYDY